MKQLFNKLLIITLLIFLTNTCVAQKEFTKYVPVKSVEDYDTSVTVDFNMYNYVMYILELKNDFNVKSNDKDISDAIMLDTYEGEKTNAQLIVSYDMNMSLIKTITFGETGYWEREFYLDSLDNLVLYIFKSVKYKTVEDRIYLGEVASVKEMYHFLNNKTIVGIFINRKGKLISIKDRNLDGVRNYDYTDYYNSIVSPEIKMFINPIIN